jgi:hypothetical protein
MPERGSMARSWAAWRRISGVGRVVFPDVAKEWDMALNESLTWDEVGNISTGPGTVRDAFQLAYGKPTKELLPAGMSLYKFNGYSTLSAGVIDDETPLSPWWSPTRAFKHDAGLEQRKQIAMKSGVSLREWARLTSVIKENWNSLEWLLIVELKEPVHAWFGGFKGMARIDAGSISKRDGAVEARGAGKNLPGGGTQFYIPNLKVAHIKAHFFQPI